MADQDDEYSIPLQDQRVFGAGIKRKRIQFVPSSSTSSSTLSNPDNGTSVGDHYLSIVLSKSSRPASAPQEGTRLAEKRQKNEELATQSRSPTSLVLCEICRLPISSSDTEASVTSKPHEASLAHQVCLSHSYPPSHYDRERQGLRYLSSYGWDPDSRLGLGASGGGIMAPLKAKVKNNTLGIGVKLPKKTQMKMEKVRKLNAKEVRRKDAEGRKKADRLREMFYRSEDLDRYLG
ncbi:MAG: hypothetical protein M1834_006961 [Cirrosporium novae-zelandiae]|nr:MAG: hypothetical protein M1834_006961 [Cirrosporium novae-zelandiae]